jgi:primosomal protein N' (replication factor Y)
MALLRAESTRMSETETFIQQAALSLQELVTSTVEILGPAIAPLERKAGHYRMQLLVKSADRGALRQTLNPWMERMDKLKGSKRVRWSIDVDPYNLY